jgi:hypothetical protein
MNTGKFLGGALIVLLFWCSEAAGAPNLLEIWPRQIEVEVLPLEAQQLGISRGSFQSTINLSIDTRQLGGQTWRLWIIPRGRPANTPVELLHWEGRPPMINGTAAPDQRVLAGQGAVDGRLVQTRLVFWAQGEVPQAGFFPVHFDFILERLP